MDPFTALPAAGNVLQSLTLGIQVVSQAAKFIENGGDHEEQALSILTQQLLVSNDHLRVALDLAYPRSIEPGPFSAVRHANENCLNIGKDFLAYLSQFKSLRPGNPWIALKSALRKLCVKDKLRDYEYRISEAKSNLMLALMVCDVCPSTQSDASGQQRRSAQASPATKLKDEVESMMHDFQQMQIADISSDRRYQDLLESHFLELENQFQSLSLSFIGLQGSIYDVQANLENVSRKARQQEVKITNIFLNILKYPEMFDRQSSILPAFEGTYAWLLERENFTDTVWDCFLDWLTSENSPRDFWVEGKPGSGKSTLMRWLDSNIEVKFKEAASQDSVLSKTSWAVRVDLLVVSFYFWYAGGKAQKSKLGFLQSVLYQLWKADSAVIENCVPPTEWEAACTGMGDQIQKWQETELKDMISRVVLGRAETSCILFLIDGLDEYEGSIADREDIVTTVRSWTEGATAKVCFSSRPWNVYCDLFLTTPQMRLQDLTRDDISIFVDGHLQQHALFKKHAISQPEIAKDIAYEIVDKARGVFLWVRLVINELLKQLIDGADLLELMSELHEMPEELEEFFMRMMQSIDARYRSEAAKLLQIVAHDIDFLGKGSGGLSNESVLMHDLMYLPNARSTFFSLELLLQDSRRVNTRPHTDYELMYDALKRRINSRSMGLLETTICYEQNDRSLDPFYEHGAGLMDTKVGVIHRTVKDFLNSPTAQTMLRQYTHGDSFDALVYLYNAWAMRISYFPWSGHWNLSRFLRFITDCFKQRPQHSEENCDLFESLLSRKHVQQGLSAPTSGQITETSTRTLTLEMALKFDWPTYLKLRMRTEDVALPFGTPLVDRVLGIGPQSSMPQHLDADVIRHVVRLHTATDKSDLLIRFVQKQVLKRSFREDNFPAVSREIVLALLDNGARRFYRADELWAGRLKREDPSKQYDMIDLTGKVNLTDFFGFGHDDVVALRSRAIAFSQPFEVSYQQ